MRVAQLGTLIRAVAVVGVVFLCACLRDETPSKQNAARADKVRTKPKVAGLAGSIKLPGPGNAMSLLSRDDVLYIGFSGSIDENWAVEIAAIRGVQPW